MHVDLLPSEQWESLNERLSQVLKLPPDVSARAASGLAVAVFDVVHGLSQFYSHKRAAAAIKGGSHAYLGILPLLYKEGFQIQNIPLADIGAKQWVDNLSKDTNFVLLVEDHPITGELYSWQEVDRLLNEKKIFSIRVSHANHFLDKSAPLPYSVRICAFHPQLAIIVAGQKLKAPSLFQNRQFWQKEIVLGEVESISQDFHFDPQAVEKFESHLPEGFQRFFTPGYPRLTDRALIYHPAVNGEALQAALAKRLQWAIKSPGWESRLETTSLCRWGGTNLYDDWWLPKPSDEILRGLMILGTQHLAALTPTLIHEAALECQI